MRSLICLAILGAVTTAAHGQDMEVDTDGATVKSGEVAGTLGPPPTVQQMICQYDWPCQRAIAVASCESTLNPRAYNGAGPFYGLFQIAYGTHAWRVGYAGASILYDPATNIRVAHELWKESGWRPWPHC